MNNKVIGIKVYDEKNLKYITYQIYGKKPIFSTNSTLSKNDKKNLLEQIMNYYDVSKNISN